MPSDTGQTSRYDLASKPDTLTVHQRHSEKVKKYKAKQELKKKKKKEEEEEEGAQQKKMEEQQAGASDNKEPRQARRSSKLR